MKEIINIGDKPIILVFPDEEEEIHVEELTRIDYSNLYGEAVTVPSILNRIGHIKALLEEALSKAKMKREIYSAKIRAIYREEAASSKKSHFKIIGRENPVKLTESALDEALILDPSYEKLSNQVIELQRNFSDVDSLYWAIHKKNEKLNKFLKPVTPEEFIGELVETKINGVFIKKPKY